LLVIMSVKRAREIRTGVTTNHEHELVRGD
jgi:hypothetical protein